MLAPEKSGATEGIEAGAESKKGAAAQLHVIRMPDLLVPSPRAGSRSIPRTTTVSKMSLPTELLPLAYMVNCVALRFHSAIVKTGWGFPAAVVTFGMLLMTVLPPVKAGK